MSIPAAAMGSDDARRRRVRRTALLLGLVAAGFYLGFIALSVWRAGR